MEEVPENGENLGILLYIEGLVKLLGLRVKQLDIGPKALPPALPMGIKEKIFKKFTVKK
jgi:hypothetical protein